MMRDKTMRTSIRTKIIGGFLLVILLTAGVTIYLTEIRDYFRLNLGKWGISKNAG